MILSKETFPNVIAILPAAGIGSRMQAPLPKQYLTIGDKTLLEHSLSALLQQSCVYEAIVVINHNDLWYHRLPVASHSHVRAVIGGRARADSVMAALRHAQEGSWALVHDAARPCLQQDDLRRLLAIRACTKVGGILATPARDTMKRGCADSALIDNTMKYDDLWHALTPQLFARDLLISCLERAFSEKVTVPDEASALEYSGYQPLLVPGRADNIKVTYPEDLALARFFFSQLAHQESV